MTNATTLRTLVIENRFNDERLTEAQLGKESFKVLTVLYKGALDAITLWASNGANHIGTAEERKADKENALTAVKKILECYATDDNRIIIDDDALFSIRDISTTLKRMYSEPYNVANKALTKAKSTVKERAADLVDLGAPRQLIDEKPEEWIIRIEASGVDTKKGALDMLELYKTAIELVKTKEAEKQALVDAKGFTWFECVPQKDGRFADAVENYVADCLETGHNLKSRAQLKAERDARKAAEKAKKANA